MMRIILGVILTVVLLFIVWIAFLFIWGTTHNAHTSFSTVVFIGALAVAAACLWGIRQVWRRPRRRVESDSPPPHAESESVLDEAAYDVWLASNGIQTAGMSTRELANLRQRFLNEQRTASNQ
jgi:hypothetical protein